MFILTAEREKENKGREGGRIEGSKTEMETDGERDGDEAAE